MVYCRYCFIPGDKFDVKEFHWQVLRMGLVPLSLVEESINNWVESILMSSTSMMSSTSTFCVPSNGIIITIIIYTSVIWSFIIMLLTTSPAYTHRDNHAHRHTCTHSFSKYASFLLSGKWKNAVKIQIHLDPKRSKHRNLHLKMPL